MDAKSNAVATAYANLQKQIGYTRGLYNFALKARRQDPRGLDHRATLRRCQQELELVVPLARALRAYLQPNSTAKSRARWCLAYAACLRKLESQMRYDWEFRLPHFGEIAVFDVEPHGVSLRLQLKDVTLAGLFDRNKECREAVSRRVTHLVRKLATSLTAEQRTFVAELRTAGLHTLALAQLGG